MFDLNPVMFVAFITTAVCVLAAIQSRDDINRLCQRLREEQEAHNRTYARMIRAELCLEKIQKSEEDGLTESEQVLDSMTAPVKK